MKDVVSSCADLLNGANTITLNLTSELEFLCTSDAKIEALDNGYVITVNKNTKSINIRVFNGAAAKASKTAPAPKKVALEKPDPNVPFSDYYAPPVIDDIISILKSEKTSNIWLYGPTQCLAGETMIPINRGGKGRSFPIRYIYEMTKGKDSKWDKNVVTNVRSLKDGNIGLNQMFDIVYSGVKPVLKIELENGFSIRITKNHPVMTKGLSYTKAEDLTIGMDVMVDTKEKQGKNSVNSKKEKRDFFCNLWFHPFGQKVRTNKEARGYSIRLRKYQVIFDAHNNNLDLDDFINIVKKDEIRAKTLKYVDPSLYVIHHINGDCEDNSIQNLKMISRKEHATIHSNEQNFGQGIPSFSKIVKISEDGESDTYDIKCLNPYHNFVANGIVVHNCGKTRAVKYIGWKLGRKVEPINCKGDMDSHHFFGHNTIVNGNIVFQKGCVETSMTEGLNDKGEVVGEPGILFIDEAAAMPTEIAIGLNNVLETGKNVRTLTLPEDGNRLVKSHPGWRVMLAGNNNGTGATTLASQQYTAQQCALDASLLQRMVAMVRFGYDRRAEERIVRIATNDDTEIVSLFLRFKQGIRDALKRGELITPFSTQRVIDIFDMYNVFLKQISGNNSAVKKLALGKAIYYSSYEILSEEEQKKYDELWYPFTKEKIGRWSPAFNTSAETDYM